MPLTIALPRECRGGERRVGLVPAAVARLIARDGVSLRIESGCGRAAGFHDEDYAGVEVFDDFDGVVAGADLVVKVRMPTLEEIGALAPGTVLVTLTRTFAHVAEIEALARGKITTIAMDLVPRTARARSMDALSSQATVAGYKAALLAAELSPRLFPMMTTAAGTIRPSRVVVIGAGVAGLQAIATARRLGAEVEAAALLGVSRSTLRNLRRAGRITRTYVGSMVRYTDEHITDYLNDNTIAPCPDRARPATVAARSFSTSGPTRPSGVSATSIDDRDRPDAKALVHEISRRRSG